MAREKSAALERSRSEIRSFVESPHGAIAGQLKMSSPGDISAAIDVYSYLGRVQMRPDQDANGRNTWPKYFRSGMLVEILETNCAAA